jgi:hypothetical protein
LKTLDEIEYAIQFSKNTLAENEYSIAGSRLEGGGGAKRNNSSGYTEWPLIQYGSK